MLTTIRENERTAYSRLVDREVVLAVDAGKSGFIELLRQLPSIYPTEVIESIGRLTAEGVISKQLAEKLRSDAARPRAQSLEGRSLLPVPHPLDFEWRYTANTSRDLLNLATYFTPSDGEVLLFGTPGARSRGAVASDYAEDLLFGRRQCRHPAGASPQWSGWFAAVHSAYRRRNPAAKRRRSRHGSALVCGLHPTHASNSGWQVPTGWCRAHHPTVSGHTTERRGRLCGSVAVRR